MSYTVSSLSHMSLATVSKSLPVSTRRSSVPLSLPPDPVTTRRQDADDVGSEGGDGGGGSGGGTDGGGGSGGGTEGGGGDKGGIAP